MAKKLAKKFGVWLKITRDQRGLTQQQLADAMGMTKGSISNWEHGKDTLSDDALVSLAGALRLPYFTLKQAWLTDVEPSALPRFGYKDRMGIPGLDALESLLDDFDSLPDDQSRREAVDIFHDSVQCILKKRKE